MPPRKKTKLSSRNASSTPQTEPGKQSSGATGATESAQKSDTEYDLLNDPWTDEQETALLKGIVRWKPVGMHKHFRMLAISEYMKSQGYAPASEEHTRIPGIWKKLEHLYNLPALDEREDSIMTEGDASDDSEYCPFELPHDEFGDLMFAKRLAAERSESPDTSTHRGSRRGSTVADTDEPRSSPAPSRGRRGKPTRSSTRGTTRTTRLQVEVEKPSSGPTSAADEDEEMEDADANEGADEDGSDGGEEDNNDEEEDTEAASSPATRSTRTQTIKSKQKDKKAAGVGGGGTTTRRTGRRR